MTFLRSLRCLPLLCALAGVVLLATPGITAAAGSQQAIAESFNTATSETFVAGSLVSLRSGSLGSIGLATAKTAETIVGITGGDPLVVLSGKDKTIPVIVSGTTTVLVSTMNGPVKAGDKLTASPIAGVAMRATLSGQVVGTAQKDLDISKTAKRTIKDKNGAEKIVSIGSVPTRINVSRYQAPANPFIPPFIQTSADTLAGRPVSLLRMIACSVLLLFAFIGTAILLRTSIHSGMIALGRNPLAAETIHRGMWQVGLAAALILVLSLLAGYLVLAA